MRLGAQVVEAAIAGHLRGKRVRVWDDGGKGAGDKQGVNGLFLQITPGGSAVYYLRFRRPSDGQSSDIALGKATLISAEMARNKARAMLRRMALDRVDPVEAQRADDKARAKAKADRATETFAALARDFLAAPKQRPRSGRTIEEQVWRFDSYILPLIGKRSYRELTRREVRECVRAIWRKAGGNSQDRRGNRLANLCHGDIRSMMNWAMDEELAEANPAAFSKIFDDKPIKRVGKITDGTLRALWRAFEAEHDATFARERRRRGGAVSVKHRGDPSVVAIQLCFLTLQRPNEIAKAHRDDFDWKERVWRIHPDRNKTDQFYEVPLTDMTLALFQGAFSRSKGKWAFPAQAKGATRNGEQGHIGESTLRQRFSSIRAKLIKAKQLTSNDLQLYDARRFGRTAISQRLGIPVHVAERVLNHSQDRSIAATYDVADYSAELRKAHEAWTAELMRVVSGEEYNASSAPTDRAATTARHAENAA